MLLIFLFLSNRIEMGAYSSRSRFADSIIKLNFMDTKLNIVRKSIILETWTHNHNNMTREKILLAQTGIVNSVVHEKIITETGLENLSWTSKGISNVLVEIYHPQSTKSLSYPAIICNPKSDIDSGKFINIAAVLPVVYRAVSLRYLVCLWSHHIWWNTPWRTKLVN